MPEVLPLKVKDPKVCQPKFPMRSLPANTLHIGPSGSGKSVALIRTLVDSDKLGGCFDVNLHAYPEGAERGGDASDWGDRDRGWGWGGGRDSAGGGR